MVRNTITIDRPPDVVFDYVTNLEREQEWNPALKCVRKLTSAPLGAGTRYAVSFAGVGESIIEILRFERPTLWQSRSSSARLDVRFAGRISPVPHGSHVEVETELIPHGLLRVAGPLLEWRMRASWRHHLIRVKRILESSGSGTGSRP